MENVIIESTSDRPWIKFLFSEGIISIGGKSLPEDPFDFYEPLISSVKRYSEENDKNLIFQVKFDYFNTASSKMILEIFESLPENSVIEWYYFEDDEDMQEAGEEYMEIIRDDIKLNIYPMTIV